MRDTIIYLMIIFIIVIYALITGHLLTATSAMLSAYFVIENLYLRYKLNKQKEEIDAMKTYLMEMTDEDINQLSEKFHVLGRAIKRLLLFRK